jgi:uncharacterized protein YcbK (DUF882 family)
MMKYFNYSEFDSPDVQGSGQMMDKDFLNLLDQARDRFDKPININSGFRTPAHNESVGGKENSSHLKGLAVDVACIASRDRFELIDIFLDLGINRIGIADTFIHIDVDPEKSSNVIWTY